MTDDKIFERIARAWLEQGPATAPQRAIDAALMTIETTPQQRSLRVPRRFLRMTTQNRFLSVAVIGVFVIAVGAFMFRSPQGQIGAPRPSASSTAAPSMLSPTPDSTVSARPGMVWERKIPLDFASGIALATDGSLLVGTGVSGGLVYAISADGAQVGRWGDAGFFPAELGDVTDIAVGPDGSVYVADWLNSRIAKFDASGHWLTSFAAGGSPKAIAIGPDGLVYALSGNTLDVFDADGTPVRSMGSLANKFGQLTGLAFANGRLYVADGELNQVWMLGAEFEVLGTFGSAGSDVGEFQRIGLMTADANGHIYVTDQANHRVQEFDGSGNYLETHLLVANDHLQDPRDVAIGPDGDLYISATVGLVQRQHATTAQPLPQ